MFQRFGLQPKAASNSNRAGAYRFDDLRDIGASDEEADIDRENTPEKVILRSLHERNSAKLSPLPAALPGRKAAAAAAGLRRQPPRGEEESKEESNDDFVVAFMPGEVEPEAEVAAAGDGDGGDDQGRFQLYEDATPLKPAKESFLVSPDVRFKSGRRSDKANESNQNSKPYIRSPLGNVNVSNTNKPTNVEVVEVETVEDGFDVEQLFSKIRHNRMQFVVESFEGGCDPFVQDANGNTMLHVCAQNNIKKMANLCIKHGCDINARNRKGMTPLDYCDMLTFSGLAEWMVIMGAENSHASSRPVGNFQTTRGMR
jgi:hypothetical protein